MAVTRYKAIKWVKAAFEIVIAIIIIVFENKILFGVVPEFSLLVALLWFLVIWCIIAVVRDIVLSLRPEPKNSLRTLNEKIDALDKKLVTMGFASETIPDTVPPSPEDLKKRGNKKIMIAAGIVAAIVVIAAITTVFLMTKMGGGGNPAGGATPEETLLTMIDKMNAGDASGVVSLTVYAFGNSSVREQAIHKLNTRFSQAGDSFYVSLVSHQIKFNSTMNTSEKQEVAVTVGDIQDYTSKHVQNSCLVYYTMNITTGNGSMEMTRSMAGVKIDNAWYMMLELDGSGPGDNQQSSANDVFWSFMDRIGQKDQVGAADLTAFRFGNSSARSQTEQDIASMWQGASTFQVNVDSMNVLNWSDLNSMEQMNLSGIRDQISSQFGISISESCFIQYTITITKDGVPSVKIGRMAAFKVDQGWYLKLGAPNGGQPEYTVTIGWNHPGAFYNLNVDSITGAGSSIGINDVYLNVRYANSTVALGHMQLSMMPVGSSINGIEFVEVLGSGTLDAGDNFSLDDTMFGPGTDFILENAMGTQKYCHVTI